MRNVSWISGLLSIALLVQPQAGFAGGDVTSLKAEPGQSDYVRVTKLENGKIRFEYCESRDDKECKNLGPKNAYSLTELKYREKKLKESAYRMVAADAGYVALTAVGATLAMILTGGASTTAIAISATSGAFGGVTVLARSFIQSDTSNFYREFKSAWTLDRPILEDQDVQIKEPMIEFAKRLNSVLNGTL